MKATNSSIGLTERELQYLRVLVQVNRNCRDFYADAATGLSNPVFTDLFAELARERRRHELALSNVLWSNFAESQQVDRCSDLASSIASKSDRHCPTDAKLLVAEAERKEGWLKQQYCRALRDIGGRGIRQLLFEQLNAMEKSHTRILKLKSCLKERGDTEH